MNNQPDTTKQGKNADKIILDLCGGTGSWSKPYKDAGYDVRIITLPEFSVEHVFMDLGTIKFFNQLHPEDDLEILSSSVYGVLAAPPCTMFSMARTVAKTPRDMYSAMKVVKACLEIVYFCQYDGKKLKFWALENPKARLRWFMGLPAMTFQPFEFGDPHSKKTDIWGNFNTDLKRTPVELDATQRKQSHLNTRELPPIPEDYTLDPNMSKRAIARSITPQGFAKAFMEANK